MINSKKILENPNLTENEKKEFIEILENQKWILFQDYSEEFLFRPTLHGDYVGSSVECANYETMQERTTIHDNENEKCPFIFWNGSYSSREIQILPEHFYSSDLEFLKGIIEELENYPVLDDNKLSEIESDLMDKTVKEFKKDNEHKYFFNDNYSEIAYDFLRECICFAYFIDYAEDGLINHLQKNNAIFSPTEKIIDIIKNCDIDEKAILEELDFSIDGEIEKFFTQKTSEEIGKFISSLNLPENEIQRIKENF